MSVVAGSTPTARKIVLGSAQPLVKDSPARIAVSKPTLFDIPVSNHGARVRWLIYKKGLDIDIAPPSTVGGLRSPAYLAANPQGKMPLLVLPDGFAIPESEVIVQHMLRVYRDQGPLLLAINERQQTIADLVTRIVDMYINSVQGCLYKDGDIAQRAEQIAQIAKQLDILDSIIEGPWATGPVPTSADGALVATMAWLEYILPKKFGWSPVAQRASLASWYGVMQDDDAGAKVIKELQDGLSSWDEGGRWEQKGITQQVQDTSYRWRF